MKLSGSSPTIWHFIVFLLVLYSDPDDDRKSGRNMLIMDKT